MASHIHLDVEQIPDVLLRPPPSLLSSLSLRGSYHSWRGVFMQSLTLSDIELVFRMVQFRCGVHAEL